MAHAERVEVAPSVALRIEELGLPLHVGGVLLFDGDARDDGEEILDIERVQDIVERVLPAIPRARQRLREIPFERQWVWTDDERFNLHYHVRHSRLPRPGDARQLKRLLGRLMSERLDRNKPLWELWVIEGLQDACFAVMLKAHPCVLEGASIDEVFSTITRLDGMQRLPKPLEWKPRPVPAVGRLLADSASYWSARRGDLLEGARDVLAHPLDTLRSTGATLRELAGELTRESHRTPLNPRRIGGHRRVEMLSLPGAQSERIARVLSVSVVDVALACVAGGLEMFLRERGDKLEPPRILALVSLPPESDAGEPERRSLRLSLPLGMMHPVERLVEVTRARIAAEDAEQDAAGELRKRLETWIPARIQKVAYAIRPRGIENLAIEIFDVPDELPALLGARSRAPTLFAPLVLDRGLGIAITCGGDGELCMGFNSDWDLFPDLHALVSATEACFAQLGAQTEKCDDVRSERRPT